MGIAQEMLRGYSRGMHRDYSGGIRRCLGCSGDAQQGVVRILSMLRRWNALRMLRRCRRCSGDAQGMLQVCSRDGML